jgi:phage protein D
MEARRILTIIKYNNKDISADISKYLKSISYTDNLSGEADDLQITLEDKAGLWQSTWIPEKGALLDVMLQQKYWQTLSELPQSLRLGLFEIDEITSSGYPSEVQIKAVSVPDNNTLRGTERSRSWEKAKLQVIANDIASAAGMSLFWDTEENPVLDRAEQTEQSDLSFLYAICKDKGLALKISDKKIIIFDEAKYEAEKAKITIVKPGTVYKKESGMKYLFVGTGYSLRTKIRDIYAACRVSYQQGSSKSNIEATYTVAGKKGKTLQVNEQVESVAAALNLAKKRLRGKNKDEVTGSLNMLGNFILLSGVTVNLLGFGAFDDKYLITRASHDIGSGYTTNIDVRRCLNGY